MIETRIDLPGAPEQVRKLVEAADAVFRDWAENSHGVEFSGVWTADGLAPVTDRVRLTVRKGPDEIARSVPISELIDSRDARDAVVDALRGVLSASSNRTIRELRALVEEIKADRAAELEPVGA